MARFILSPNLPLLDYLQHRKSHAANKDEAGYRSCTDERLPTGRGSQLPPLRLWRGG